MNVDQEYARIKALFDGAEQKQLDLVDGLIWEAARLRIELDGLNKIVQESGLIKVNPDNLNMQKELPVSRMIVKVRANYLNYIAKLNNILGCNAEDDEDGLGDYE